jgi:hypothetical protein
MNINMNTLENFAGVFFEISVVVISLVAVLLVLAVIYMYIADVTQTKQTIRRNYPVLGRFREFFRQNLFPQDREELPFNRAQRSWVYRAAKNIDSTVAFGSTRPLNQPGNGVSPGFLHHRQHRRRHRCSPLKPD